MELGADSGYPLQKCAKILRVKRDVWQVATVETEVEFLSVFLTVC
jgi:hypothetical protein